ncbi:hypothetical protein PAHAL_4G346500 [Panicum hallii]|uniref:Uncharacterized protein n=1 Tax=Panicum hallii TaxID=206008 RepID=A0A2T8JF29_9POAL|nr:hypothetical protein PAHAL_4G346500 [Panicum hallii]
MPERKAMCRLLYTRGRRAVAGQLACSGGRRRPRLSRKLTAALSHRFPSVRSLARTKTWPCPRTARSILRARGRGRAARTEKTRAAPVLACYLVGLASRNLRRGLAPVDLLECQYQATNTGILLLQQVRHFSSKQLITLAGKMQ